MSNDDILVGMKEICVFLRVSRRVVNRWMKECPDIPIVKDGQMMAVTSDLGEWQRQHIKRKALV